jgi:hypothetical protein
VDEAQLIKQRLDLLDKQMEVNSKAAGLEFERIGKAFSQLGNLMDLLYLEVSVLIETLGKKDVIKLEEFQKELEATAKKVEAQIAEAAKAEAKEEPKIEKL